MPSNEFANFPDVIYDKLPPPDKHPMYHYNGFEPGKSIIKKGHVKSPGYATFPVDVIFDRDVAITARDGVKLYADIFRPVGSDTEKVPVIIPWSPYGKTGTGPQNYESMAPFHAGFPKSMVSGYHKFEAPDPAEWCKRGYAILNIDARGAGHSEGNISQWGLQEAEDIYDVITWLTEQSWCSGSVAMAGNSWLSIAQLSFASRLSHPALKALAPWEGLIDPYRELAARGFGSAENVAAMLEKRPLYDEYWETKRIPVENIDNIPLYLLASYSSMLHTHGSFHTWQVAKTKQKWLRVHPYQEWYDLYRPEITDELQKYFDHYCKGIQNGWEDSTPPVRLSLVGFEGSPAKTVTERVEQEYPLKRRTAKDYYLDVGSKTMSTSPISTESKDQYEAHSLDASLDFKVHFDEATELSGYPKVKLYVSCAEHDDMDICVQIRKISTDGIPMKHLNYPCPVPVEEVPELNVAQYWGPQGFLRASHAVSRAESPFPGMDPNDIFYTHRVQEKIEPGKVVCVEIPIWPIGMVFAQGEGVMLRVSGHDMCPPETDLCRLKEPEDENVGKHVVYTGGKYESVLTLPVVPLSSG
ncbi:hypothetical protein BP5796_07789 [Coleophoma crateriformis]|uniref:Xaa-Pro dipeptidyl-peptidase C-terminal domain-containing protein n=1 Tax=Coleophoma crateriformis TaxID=565419 RepID=A0A3D8RCK5_9HELO|nr:hypothetical protein BP5796_07789 [Coleophoma crateriformis]